MRVIRSGDMLFLAGGSNDVLRLYAAEGFAAAVPVAAWADRMAARGALFARLGVPWCLLLAPEKLSVLGDEVLSGRVTAALPPAARLQQAIGRGLVADPRDFLRTQHQRGYAMYPRTDSHWTCLGALSAFQWAAPILGLRLDYTPYRQTASRLLSYYGDLWTPREADLSPDSFERRALPASLRRTYANEIVLLKESAGLENEAGLHVGSAVAFLNEAAPVDERLVLFGSSFSDYRAECSLLTFVAALFFREVHFVWSASLDIGLIERLAPDRVLIEMPERFLTTCPADDFDLAAHAAAAVANWRKGQGRRG